MKAGGPVQAVNVCSEVAALIRERYPHDLAVGDCDGYLRGAVSEVVVAR